MTPVSEVTSSFFIDNLHSRVAKGSLVMFDQDCRSWTQHCFEHVMLESRAQNVNQFGPPLVITRKQVFMRKVLLVIYLLEGFLVS